MEVSIYSPRPDWLQSWGQDEFASMDYDISSSEFLWTTVCSWKAIFFLF